MARNTKRVSLLLLGGTLVLLILLSASLSNVQLLPGAPFPGASDSGPEIQSSSDPGFVGSDSLIILKGVFPLVFLILIVYVAARLIMFVTIKRLAQLLFIIAALLIVIIMIPQTTHDQLSRYTGDHSRIINPQSPEYPVSPLGKPPQVFYLIVLIGFVLGVGLLALLSLKSWLQPDRTEEQLLREAEAAVVSIQTGENLRNVILHCYLHMTHALQKDRQIERNDNMTVREFESWLNHKGFPFAPVNQLTRLFEKVRYGAQLTTKDDEADAIDCLNEIILFCRSERKYQ